jgi:alpha-L-rhamnosidase
MIDHGATTTWEYWNGERSHVHNCYNGIGIWFIQALGGIVPDPMSPGYRHVFITPQQPKGISWASAEKETPYGTIRTRWNQQQLMVEIPVGMKATVSWKGKRFEVQTGKWTF